MKTTKHFFTSIAFVIFGMSVGIAQAAGVNYFLKIGDIAGGSVDNKHSAWIDIDSFSWGISNTSPIGHGGGGQIGKAVFSPFSWTQQLDKSVPPMFVGVASGTRYKNATLDVTRSGGKSSDVFFKMSFDDVLLSKIDIAGAGAIPGVAGALIADAGVVIAEVLAAHGGGPAADAVEFHMFTLRGGWVRHSAPFLEDLLNGLANGLRKFFHNELWNLTSKTGH